MPVVYLVQQVAENTLNTERENSMIFKKYELGLGEIVIDTKHIDKRVRNGVVDSMDVLQAVSKCRSCNSVHRACSYCGSHISYATRLYIIEKMSSSYSQIVNSLLVEFDEICENKVNKLLKESTEGMRAEDAKIFTECHALRSRLFNKERNKYTKVCKEVVRAVIENIAVEELDKVREGK